MNQNLEFPSRAWYSARNQRSAIPLIEAGELEEVVKVEKPHQGDRALDPAHGIGMMRRKGEKGSSCKNQSAWNRLYPPTYFLKELAIFCSAAMTRMLQELEAGGFWWRKSRCGFAAYRRIIRAPTKVAQQPHSNPSAGWEKSEQSRHVTVIPSPTDVLKNDTLFRFFCFAIARKRAIAKQKKRNRVSFFNTPDGVSILLGIQKHPQRDTKRNKHCVLCGSGSKRRTSNYMWATYNVHPYVCIGTGNRKSCWFKWHELQRIEDLVKDKRAHKYLSKIHGTSSNVPVQNVESATNATTAPAALSLQTETVALWACASGCGREPLFSPSSSAHIFQNCSHPMHAFCAHALGGNSEAMNMRGVGPEVIASLVHFGCDRFRILKCN